MIGFDVSNLISATAEFLASVEDSVGESTLRTVGFAGAEIFRDQAKQNALAHKKTGVLYDNIIVKRLEEDSDGGKRQTYRVTVRSGAVTGDGGYYWRWVERGHKFVPKNTNISARTGKRVGWAAHRAAAELEYGSRRVPAYPFMRPAYESKKGEVMNVMTETLKEQIERNASR